MVMLPIPKPKYPPMFHIASEPFGDILKDPDFSSYFDVVSKHDIVMSGHIGSFHGVNILADGFKI